jgi:PKD repeat protein
MSFFKTAITITFIAFTSLSLSAQIPATGQVLWLKADKGVTLDAKGYVSVWADQSGNKVDAKQASSGARPKLVKNTINGLPVLRFDGSSDYMSCPSKFPVKSDFTIIVLARINNYSNYNTLIGGNTDLALWTVGSNKPSLWGNFASKVATLSAIPADFTVITATVNIKGRVASIYINDSLSNSGTDTIKNTDAGINIGAIFGSSFLDGDIAEIIIYKRVLSKPEIDSVNNYFNDKYLLKGTNKNVVMSNFPAYYKFYPRDASDSAIVKFDGKAISAKYDSVKLDVYKDDTLWKSFGQLLSYSAGAAYFSFKPKIKAGLYEYSFKLHLKNSSTDTLVGYRKDVVCGDVYMVDGQSNTVFVYATSNYTNEFVRTFGSNTGGGNGDPTDTFWNKANGSSWLYYTICSWGIKMAQMLKEKEKMPICVVNQGVGGTTVGFHLEDTTNPTNLIYNYGRLLYRMQKAGIQNAVKAIFWYQGESNSIYYYSQQFHTLYREWKKTYLGFKHFYMMQIHTGCNSGNAAEVREFDRAITDTLGNATTVSTTNLPGHDLDHCHYYESGYDSLGVHLFRLVNKDFYNSPDTLNVRSPNVKKVFYTDSTYKEIGILFREKNAGLSWTKDVTQILNSGKAFRFNIRHAFYLDDSFDRVNSVIVSGDTLKLKLKSPLRYSRINYIPDTYYENTATYYEGPWLINKRQIGALTFFHFPIDTFVPKTHAVLAFTTDSICIGQATAFHDKSSLKYGAITLWQWNFGDSSGSALQNPVHTYKAAGSYAVQLKAINSTNAIDSITVTVNIHGLPDAAFKVKGVSGRTYSFIPYDSLLSTYTWDFGDGSISNKMKRSYTYSTDGTYLALLKVSDSAGCRNQSTDTLNIVLTRLATGEELLTNSLSISPNPFTESVNVSYTISENENIKLLLINNEGKTVYTFVNGPVNRGSYSIQFNALQSSIKAGQYQVILMTPESRISKSLIKL